MDVFVDKLKCTYGQMVSLYLSLSLSIYIELVLMMGTLEDGEIRFENDKTRG